MFNPKISALPHSLNPAQASDHAPSFFVGNYYEVPRKGYEVMGGVVTKYYYAGSQRIAMRANGVLSFLPGDHLGSTSLVTDTAGGNAITTLYKAWGEVRYSSGALPTRYQFTGQYSDNYINLLWYNSRYYDPELGRFIQPDSIVPLASQGVQAWDRYAYVNNDPIRYTDPTGHCPLCVTAVIGGAIGGIVGAVGYIAYIAATGHEWNGTHFWAVTGGGALAGTLIGTGVGAAQGLTVAGATTAGVEAGAVVEGANVACGGDMCASEVQDTSQAAQEVLPAVENQASQITNAINTGTNTVYRYVQNGVTKYVGITNNFERRADEWGRATGWRIDPVPGLRDNLSRFDARAVEQVLIEQTGLSNLENQINSIATSNPIYAQALQRGTEILRMIGHIPR